MIDKESFNKIWEEVIYKEVINYQKVYPEAVELIPNAKDRVFAKFVEYVTFCSNNYKSSFDKGMKRHRLSACMMSAVVNVHPLIATGDSVPGMINETLAITVGLSILRAFILADLYSSGNKSSMAKFDEGLKLPDDILVTSNSYLCNYAKELYYASIEGNVCILSIAHELFLLEVFNKVI